LGTALYLDRPLGAFKAPGEPDATFLFSYVAFSRSLASQRLDLLRNLDLLDAIQHDVFHRRLAELPVVGVPMSTLHSEPSPGVVSLADARRVAEDFVFLHTTKQVGDDFHRGYGLDQLARMAGLAWLDPRRLLVIGGMRVVPQPELVLTIYDDQARLRLE